MGEAITGFILCIISCIAFGFMFAPLRNLNCKDGFYVQWIQCAVVFFVGFTINSVRGFPAFNPIAMIGGFLFATGNIVSVPIISNLGIGVGMLVWGSTQVLVGWGVARFGLFGTHPQPVYNNTMNMLGLLFVLLSGFMFIFVKHQRQERDSSVKSTNINSTTAQVSVYVAQETHTPVQIRNQTKLMFHAKIRFLGLSVFLGIFHGLMMTPIVYIQENDLNASSNVLDYVFPHFSTIFACSTAYFIAYCVWMRGRIYAPAELILPSTAYGILWCIGMSLWIISNHMLSQTVSFPITTRLPSTIGVLADMLLFRTIKGTKNLILAFLAVIIGLFGVLLIALSNQHL